MKLRSYLSTSPRLTPSLILAAMWATSPWRKIQLNYFHCYEDEGIAFWNKLLSVGPTWMSDHITAFSARSVIQVCLCVCLYVSIYVCMYVCIPVCMYVLCMSWRWWTNLWDCFSSSFMYVCLSVYLPVFVYLCMYVSICMNVCMYPCMSVCTWLFVKHCLGISQGRSNGNPTIAPFKKVPSLFVISTNASSEVEKVSPVLDCWGHLCASVE